MNTDFCDTDNCVFSVSSSLKPTHTEHSKYRYDISEKTDLYQCAAAKCPSPGEVVGKLVPKNHRHSPNPAMSFFLQFLSILYNSPRKSHVCSSIPLTSQEFHPFSLISSFRRPLPTCLRCVQETQSWVILARCFGLRSWKSARNLRETNQCGAGNKSVPGLRSNHRNLQGVKRSYGI